jgi:hypothetical protein
MMKTQFFAKTSSLALLIFAMFSCFGSAQNGKTPTITKTFELNKPGTLNSVSSGGGITVKTHNKNEVVVQTFVRKNGKVLSPSDPDVDKVLEYYDLEIEKNGTVINANAKRISRKSYNTGIYFKILVPREMSCNVSSSGGGLKISGVEGTHDFKSSGGSVYIENITGNTKASSSGGKVKASNMQGDIHLSSSGGSVSVEIANGSVYAKSSGGGVNINDVIGDVEAASSGGSVHVTGACESVKASSSGGSVNVNISNLKNELHLQSSGGGVNAVIQGGDQLGLDLDLKSSKVNIDLSNFSGRSEKNSVKGSTNGGGIPVYMKASGGNVNVNFKE